MAKSTSIPQSPIQVRPLAWTASGEAVLAGRTLLDWKFWLRALLIIGSVLWIYSPVYHGGWMMDDNLYLYENPLMNDPHRLWKAWFEPGSFIEYYPIEQTFQWALWQLWHENTFGYHLTNALLHAFSALLVWRVLSKFQLRGAWLGGLLFAVHPALVESVAWIVELKNTLSLPPFLIAICFYIAYEKDRREQDYFMALGCFLIAMLCKISMAPFPVVILLYAWWRHGRIGWRDIKASLPFFAVSVVLAELTLRSGDIYSGQHMMETHISAGGWASRLALIGGTLSFYVSTSLWPFGLLPLYPRWSIVPPTFLQFLPWPIFAAILYFSWRRRSSWGRHVILGFGFFALTLAPFLGFIIASYMRISWVMDHFLYIPIIGLIGLVVASFDSLTRSVSAATSGLAQVVAVLVASLLAWSSHHYASQFINQETLWNYTLARNPSAWPAYNNLGAILLKQKNQVTTALDMFTKALALNPDYFEARYNKGITLDRLNRSREAIEEYQDAVRISPMSGEARRMLAQALQKNGDARGAIEQLLILLRYFPDNGDAHEALGSLYIQMGMFPEAAEQFQIVTEIYPSAASPYNDLGNALFMTGQHDLAIADYREAMRLNPSMVEAHNNLAGALQHTGHVEEAIREYYGALQIDPANLKLHINLASALAQKGQKEEAIREYETALRLDPANTAARDGLAALQSPAPAKTPKK